MARLSTGRPPGTKAPDAVNRILGVGWAYPLAVEPGGTIAVAAYEEDVSQAIMIILGTNPGERVMRPTYGAGLRDFVFGPISAASLALVKQRVLDALVDEEPRIDVDSVDVAVESPGSSTVLINVAYRVRSTNTRANVVYPFYLKEGAST